MMNELAYTNRQSEAWEASTRWSDQLHARAPTPLSGHWAAILKRDRDGNSSATITRKIKAGGKLTAAEAKFLMNMT
jgi:hypothetical protein